MENKSLLNKGTQLFHGKYLIQRYLSSGGFGNTYEATDTSFNERVAIKELFVRGMCGRGEHNGVTTLDDNKQSFDSLLQKFKKEAIRLRSIDHQNIVKVRDFFEENGTAYYVMDFLEGTSLVSVIKASGKPLTEDKALDIFNKVLSALECIHNNNIWHLDIKPGNIMIDKDFNPILIDFGASKQLKDAAGNAMSTSSSLVLTPGFAPAEQMEQDFDKFGPWTDFYAIGATLYFCLTLRVPPMPSDIAENGAASLNMPKSLSDKTQQLITWLLEPNRNKRPQNVAEINQWMNGASAKTVSNSLETVVAERNPQNTKKNINKGEKLFVKTKVLFILLLLTIVICFGVGAFFIVNGSDNSSNLYNVSDSTKVVYVPRYCNIRQLYSVTESLGVNDVYNIDTFVKKLGDNDYRLKIYGFLKKNNCFEEPSTYDDFCFSIGYGRKDSLINRKMEDLYHLIDLNISCNVKSMSDLKVKMQNKDFVQYIYNKIKELDVYGIGKDAEEFRRIVYCETYQKGIDASFETNRDEVYNLLHNSVGNTKDYFMKYLSAPENIGFQRTMYKMLKENGYNKYSSFQEFQSAMHPGLLE